MILLPAVLMISFTMLSASAAENARVNGVEIAVGEEFVAVKDVINLATFKQVALFLSAQRNNVKDKLCRKWLI